MRLPADMLLRLAVKEIGYCAERLALIAAELAALLDTDGDDDETP